MSKIPKNLSGLMPAEVQERVRAGQVNIVDIRPSKSVKEIIFSNIFTYFNLIFTIFAVLLISIGSFRDLTFLPVVIANSLIGIFQELRAKKVLDKLKIVHAPKTTVLRSGKLTSIPTSELVLDDVILLKSGDQIPADAQIVDGEVAVNEAMLTGESDEIMKHPGDDLLSGAFIVYGEAYARLTKVGMNSYAAQLTARAKTIRHTEPSAIVGSLNRLVKIIGFIIIPLGAIMFVEQFIFGGATFATSIQHMVAALIGMIPEGLFLLASVTLMLSAVRLAQQSVMLHDMKSIETLARVDTLCVDKTGTITTDEMRVVGVFSPAGKTASTDTIELIAKTVSAQSPDSATMSALQKHFHLPKNTKAPKPIHVQGFSSKYKYSGTAFTDAAYIIGAPEFIVKQNSTTQKSVNHWAEKGYRVLVFAQYDGEFTSTGALQGKTTPLGFVVLENQIRPTAPATFEYFTKQGVTVKVISGDNPVTAAEVARQAHIPHADRYIDATTLTTKAAIKKAATKYTVFGRVTPKQKRQLINALQKSGHTVAMTGDGVNDVLALKDADCSIAMASGAQAAIQAAQVVLLDSDFAKMPSVVNEGRRVVNNLERSGSLFLVKNIFSFATALFTIFLGLAYPLVPTQVSFVTMWTIGVPSFLLAQIPNHRLIRGSSFIKTIVRSALPAALTSVVLIALATPFCQFLGVPENYVSTVCALTWGVVGLMNLFRICFLSEKVESRSELLAKIGVFILCILGMASCFIFLPWLFAIEIGGLLGWAVIGLMAILAPFLLAGFNTILKRWRFAQKIFA